MVTQTQSTDSIQTGAGVAGLTYDANNETLIIDPDVVIFSKTSFGISSVGTVVVEDFANNILRNFGRIYTAAQDAGVHFDVGNGKVFNATGAEIFGARNGIDLEGAGNQVLNNSGAIIGADNNGVFFAHPTTGVLVNNHGYIFGATFGVENASQNVGGTINNFHVIKAAAAPPNPPFMGAVAAAIFLDTAPTLVTHITNAAGALINGAVDAIEDVIGRFHLVNDGNIVGNVVDADGANDVIINAGKIKGQVYLEGNSIYNGTGGSVRAIHVGGGNDILTGGAAADHFVFDSALTGQFETITNFQHGTDKIELSEADFPGIGPVGGALQGQYFRGHPHAMTANEHILYNPINGFLFYDQDGSGTTYAPIHFATLTNHPTLTPADFLVVG